MGSIGRCVSNTDLRTFTIIRVGLAKADCACAAANIRGRLVFDLCGLTGLFVRPTIKGVSNTAAAIGEHCANGVAN
jgi:hypothetical protein